MATLRLVVPSFHTLAVIFVLLLVLFQQISTRKAETIEKAPSSDDPLSITIEHAVEDDPEPVFKPRGTIVLKNLKSSSASFMAKTFLSGKELDKLRKVAEQDGYYHVRAPSKLGVRTDEEEITYVSSFIKACQLFESGLTDTVTLSIDSSANVYGIAVSTPYHECKEQTTKKIYSSSNNAYFNTSVIIQHQIPGPIPDTASYIQKLEKEQSDKAAGKEKDNRSFFAKYWMYIVPVMILLMMSGQQETPGGGGGGEGGN